MEKEGREGVKIVALSVFDFKDATDDQGASCKVVRSSGAIDRLMMFKMAIAA